MPFASCHAALNYLDEHKNVAILFAQNLSSAKSPPVYVFSNTQQSLLSLCLTHNPTLIKLIIRSDPKCWNFQDRLTFFCCLARIHFASFVSFVITRTINCGRGFNYAAQVLLVMQLSSLKTFYVCLQEKNSMSFVDFAKYFCFDREV